MQEDKTVAKLLWCFRVKNGIEIVGPSDNLARAYMNKSETALLSMDANAKARIKDWFVSASYYAKYFAVYALLLKFGFKCENHDCTIALFEYLFKDALHNELIEELRTSKSDRIEAQYYTSEININIEGVSVQTKRFVLEINGITEKATRERIDNAREDIKTLLGK